MTTIDLNAAATSGDALSNVQALLEENDALRAYLKRVVAMLEERVEDHGRPTVAIDHPFPGTIQDPDTNERLIKLEHGLHRIEENIQTLLWLLSDEPSAAAG